MCHFLHPWYQDHESRLSVKHLVIKAVWLGATRRNMHGAFLTALETLNQ